MSTIKELSWQLIEMANGGMPTDDSKLNYRIARAHVRDAVAYLLKEKIFQHYNSSEDHYIPDSNSISKEVELKHDSESGLSYVETIGESIDLTGMRNYQLSFANIAHRWKKKFVPISRQEVFLQTFLTNIPDVVQFYKEGDRLYLIGNILTDGGESLMLTQKNVVPKDDDDPVPVDIASQSLERAYRSVYPEISAQQDRDNNGVDNK